MNEKLDCGYILQAETTGFQIDSMWGERETEKSRKTQATKSCFLVGKAVGRGAFTGKGQKFSLEHVELEMCYLDIQGEMWNKQLDVLIWSSRWISGLERYIWEFLSYRWNSMALDEITKGVSVDGEEEQRRNRGVL